MVFLESIGRLKEILRKINRKNILGGINILCYVSISRELDVSIFSSKWE